MVLLTQVTVGGVDVTQYVLDYEVTDKINADWMKGKINFVTNVQADIDLATQQDVVITRGFTTATDVTIFRGFVSLVNKEGGSVSIEIADKLWITQRRIINKSFDKDIDPEAGVGSEIAKTIIEDYAFLNATVESTGTAVILKKYLCRNDTCFERLKKLAEIWDYQLYYDVADDTVHFESKGNITYPFTLSTGSQITKMVPWDYDMKEMANNVRLIGGTQEVETTKLYDGGGTTFQLDFVPTSTKVFISGVLQAGGIENSSTSFDYQVDKVRKQIIFQSATPGGTNNVEVRYSYEVPRTVVVNDPVSISRYGVYDLVLTWNDIQDVDDAIERSRKVLERRKLPLIKTKIDVQGVDGLYAGNLVTVNDSINNESVELVVEEIKWKYPQSVDTISLGDVRLLNNDDVVVNINERLRAIERELARESDIVVQLFQTDRVFKPRRRHIKLLKKVADGSSMIWKHPTWGTWLTNQWGANGFGTEVEEEVIPGRNAFEEYIYDLEYVDTISTDATVDTSGQAINF